VAVGAVIAGFLLLMVSLGLIGVLWQNVTRRTREIGLRRALGAAGGDVQVQILTELLIATLAGVVLGAVVVVQVPLLNLFASVSAGVYAMALLVSAAAIGLITLAAGFYPSWLATRVQPADALREE
jgi:putative ABC transport system permease protein